MVYGDDDDPVMDVGVMPVPKAWECFREAMPLDTPCLACFIEGTGQQCLDGECPNPLLGPEFRPPESPSEPC